MLLKGGHLGGDRSPDLLWYDGATEWLDAPRLPGRNTHGTGCTLSAAICAQLATGKRWPEACRRAKEFVAGAITAGPDVATALGRSTPGGGGRAERLGGAQVREVPGRNIGHVRNPLLRPWRRRAPGCSRRLPAVSGCQ